MSSIKDLDTRVFIFTHIVIWIGQFSGLLDIGGEWKPPHSTHNTSKELDIAVSNLVDDQHKMLLGQVIEDEKSDVKNIGKCEGLDNLIELKQELLTLISSISKPYPRYYMKRQ